MASRSQLLGLALVLLALVAACCAATPQWIDRPFNQLQVRRWVAPGSPQIADWQPRPFDGEIYQAVSTGRSPEVWVLTSKALVLLDPSQNNTVLFSTNNVGYKKLSILDSTLLLTDETNVLRCVFVSNFKCSDPIQMPNHGPIKASLILPNGTILIASDRLYSLAPEKGAEPEQVLGAYNYSSLAYCSKTDTVAVGTDRLLWVYAKFGGGLLPKPYWRFFRVDGIIDAAITSLAYTPTGTLYIGNELALNAMNPDFTFQRYGGGLGGLPYGNITSLAVSPYGSLWIGTKRGVILFAKNKFRYFNGPRYMPDMAYGPGNAAKLIAAGSFGSDCALVVAEDGGMVRFYFDQMTLEAKANYFQTLVHPYHGRFGLVSASRLEKFGDMSSYVLQDSENDGLWTSMYLASQALRYAATLDQDARQEATNALKGLALLNNVTGIKGYFARSVLKQDTVPGGHLPWYQSKTMPGWVWQGDTSSDEVTGHIFAYTLYYKLVARTREEVDLVSTLITDMMTYIVENDFYLIGPDGKPTTWGIWNPKYVNDNPDWFDQRGLNSVQIMTWLAAVEPIALWTGKPYKIFTDAIKTLKTVHQYDLNIINAKIAIPTDDNYSDDELQHLPLYTYITSGSSSLDDTFYVSCDRTFNIVKDVQSPLWNLIYLASLNSRPRSSTTPEMSLYDFSNGINTLVEWPMSWVDWPIDNTQRLDIIVSQYPNRRGRRDLTNLLPRDEIAFYRWNADPFEYHQGGNGLDLAEPTAFLLPYWLGRYLKAIVRSN